jgi:hypothetical protein
MNVGIVSANIRYAAEAKGGWRTIELGAEADLDPGENWRTAQEQLYHELAQRMKVLWANGTSKALQAPETDAQPTPAPTAKEKTTPSIGALVRGPSMRV